MIDTAISNQTLTRTQYPAYKDSGVDWLGEIPAHWECLRMKWLFSDVSIKNKPNGELLSVTQNQGVVPRTWVENRMVMPSGNLESFKFIRKGDFAISLRSFEGGLEFCHHDGIISPAYTVLHSLRINHASFYKHLFKSQTFISELQTSIVGIREGKNISYEELCYSYLPIPPLAEQTRIAEFLDRKTAQIDQAIAQKERLIELLNERRQIMINQAVTRGLDPNVPMKDSGIDWIGEIPAHWEVKRAKYLFEEVVENTKTGKEELLSLRMNIGLVPHNDVSDTEIRDTNLIGYKIVKRGQMVMNRMRASIGLFGVANQYGLVSPDYAVYEISKTVFPIYYLNLFKTSIMGTVFRLNSKGLGTGSSGFMRIYSENFGNIKVQVPPKGEQKAIVEYMEFITSEVEAGISYMKAAIEKLQELKSTLINSAVTGKIKV